MSFFNKNKGEKILIEGLSEFDLLYAIFTVAFVIISIIIGLKLVLKYFQLKVINYITVGFAFIFLSSTWWGTTMAIITFVFFNFALDPIAYLFIQSAFIPVALLCWMYSFLELNYKHYKKKVLLVYFIIFLIYEIYLIWFLSFIDRDVIEETRTSAFVFAFQPIEFLLFQVFAVLTALISGLLFVKKSLESDQPRIRWKARFLLIAFVSLFFAGAIEAIFSMTLIMLIIVRIILIFSAIAYYFGFFLPNKLAIWLTKG